MTTSLDLPDDLVEHIRHRASLEGRPVEETVIELLRAGLAASPAPSVIVDAAMLAERRRIAEKFLTGEWGAELAGFEEGRAADRKAAEHRDVSWRR